MNTRVVGPMLIAGTVALLAACGGAVEEDPGTAGGNGGTTGSIGGSAGNHAGYGGTSNPGKGGSSSGTGGTHAGTGGTAGGVIESGPFTGVWKGYVENYHFQDGSDALTMTLYQVEKSVAGTLEVGNSAPLPPPTDPNVGYPPGANLGSGGGVSYDPHPGFSFSLVNGSFDGVRLQFGISSFEIYKAWCEMQTPVFDEMNGFDYQCLPNWGGGMDGSGCFLQNPKTNEKVYYDCGKVALCCFNSVCDCSEQSCTATLSAGVKFDMQLHPPAATGSVTGLDGNIHTVYLTKQ